MAALPGAAVVSVCDVDERVLSETATTLAEAQGRYPRKERDFRTLLDDPRVDAVVIATPDHWHAHMALAAMAAGKDVYLEPPVAHTVAETRAVAEAARKTGRIVQIGLQQRSGDHFRSAVELVQSGRLGRVEYAEAWAVHRRKPIGHQPESAVPAGVDYELWLGPAPRRAFTANRFHRNWQWFRDYGSGELGHWGVHLLDVACWGLGVDLPTAASPMEVAATGPARNFYRDDQETPDALHVDFRFPTADGAGRWISWQHRQWSHIGKEGRSAAVAFHGERGTLIVDRGGWKVYGTKDGAAADPDDGSRPHYADFLHAVRTRQEPSADVRTAALSTLLCHLGHIAHHSEESLRFDPIRGDFGPDHPANAHLAREHHPDWPLPTV
jgi:predicted dehydrogenase